MSVDLDGDLDLRRATSFTAAGVSRNLSSSSEDSDPPPPGPRAACALAVLSSSVMYVTPGSQLGD